MACLLAFEWKPVKVHNHRHMLQCNYYHFKSLTKSSITASEWSYVTLSSLCVYIPAHTTVDKDTNVHTYPAEDDVDLYS